MRMEPTLVDCLLAQTTYERLSPCVYSLTLLSPSQPPSSNPHAITENLNIYREPNLIQTGAGYYNVGTCP